MIVWAEYTDTFGGEANYSWVRRESFECDDDTSDLSIVRRVKRKMGLSGLKCSRHEMGDYLVLRPYGYNTILFIRGDYDGCA